MRNDVIYRKPLYEDLRRTREALVASGAPFLASVMEKAIKCLEEQPPALACKNGPPAPARETPADRVAVYADALATFGVETQLTVALEEMSELQKEICKALRGFTHPAELAEELADVTIMLEQLRIIFSIGPAVDQMVGHKLARLRQRIDDAKS